MPLRVLINNDGSQFEAAEINEYRVLLDALPEDQRIVFRNDNAHQIAEHPSTRLLIVSGPGTGKSTLFKQRIKYWLTQNPEARILAVSFVRKLVEDLDKDIQGDEKLTAEQKSRTEVYTLHRYARSVVEKNHGSASLGFERHLKIIGESWKELVWEDVMNFSETFEWTDFSWKNFEEQLHNAQFDNSETWNNVRQSYFTLSQFYNAAGFADLILHARDALAENPELAPHEFCIVDEFQDFNTAEDALIQQLAQHCQGLLVVGDDDQVLYEDLKSGKPGLIRSLYANEDFTNAMLPFCGRCSFHITKSSAHFIQQDAEENCIDKIYLPLSTDEECEKVQVIACATPSSAVDYIRKFIEDHQEEIEARKTDPNNKDPFLLILTPAKAVRFYRTKNADRELFDLVAEYKTEDVSLSEDYFRLLSYYSCATRPNDNFSFRKVLYFEDVQSRDAVALIRECLQIGRSLYQLDREPITSILEKSQRVRDILDADDPANEKVNKLREAGVTLSRPDQLTVELTQQPIGQPQVEEVEREEEEETELDEMETKRLSVVELMTIVGSKGLSADHVMIVGFDNVNMNWIKRNAFFVAMTRARTSLHLITALRAGGAKEPARYLENLPTSHLKFNKYVKTARQKEELPSRRAFLGFLEYLGRRR